MRCIPTFLLLLSAIMVARPQAAMRLFPATGGPGVPGDAPLRISFDQPVTFSRKGKLTVYDAETGKAVYTVDFSQIPGTTTGSGWPFQRTVGGDPLNVQPLILLEREAYIALPPRSLVSGKTYYVTLGAGALIEGGGLPNKAISDDTTWRFSILALPAGARSGYVVAADGSGDFCTLQGALDFVPVGNKTTVTLVVKPGKYPELIRSTGKNNINIVGTDRKSCIITYANNDAFNSGTSNRALARIFGNDIRLENLTFMNSTPQGGTQAEALFLRGERCLILNCNFSSYQDTLLLEGRVFLSGCGVAGAVDYIWGTGIAFFQTCTFTSNADGYIVQARNQKDAGGYVFLSCSLLASGTTKTSYLARDGNGDFPDGQVIWIDTRMGPQIPAVGWLLRAAGGSNPGFAEYKSMDLSGKPIEIGGRSGFSRQLSAAEADRFRNPANVLGGKDKWDPRAAVSTAVHAGRKRRFPASTDFRLFPASGFDLLGRSNPPMPPEGRIEVIAVP